MLDFKVVGADEMQAGVTRIADDLHGVPMVDAMRDASLIVLRDAKEYVPTGATSHLRKSITAEIRARTEFIEGVVGSNLDYAPYVELGTRPHWPPKRPIIYWAMRVLQLRGVELRAAVRGIQRKISHHGTKPQPYLSKAYEDNVELVHRIISKAVGAIISSD